MVTENKAKELARKCLDEMYKASTPSISWEEILKKYSGKKTQFFRKHKLSDEKYNSIKAKYEKKLGRSWSSSLDWMLLDYAPTFEEHK